jgi:hypothetical protein
MRPAAYASSSLKLGALQAIQVNCDMKLQHRWYATNCFRAHNNNNVILYAPITEETWAHYKSRIMLKVALNKYV